MSYCKKCGAYIPDADDICPACGNSTDEDTAGFSGSSQARAQEKTEYGGGGEYRSEEKQSGEYHGTYQSGEYHGGTYYSGYADANPNADRYSSEYDADANENRSLAYLCYLGVLFVIPYFLKPGSQFIRYHCNQGLLLVLLCVLSSMCYQIPILGWIAGTAGWFLAVSCFIKGMSNVSKGRRSPLPVIGQITLIK
ncbi:MAG: hypothetical protein EOM54_07575 [Clostridia bacterium]|nr:hypothetical protein [Clostridia bacterium]